MQSFSVNMYPDWDDESNVITRMVRRKFAFAREVAEYEELIEGEGQVSSSRHITHQHDHPLTHSPPCHITYH